MSQPMLSACPPESDHLMLSSAVAGDEIALRSLMRRYTPSIRARALRVLDDSALADEVVQDVFLTAIKHGGQFRRDASVGTWLYAIATNRSLNLRRQHVRNERRHAPPVDAEFPDHRPSPHETAEVSDRRERVMQIVASLPKRLREVATLRIEGHSYPEIAARQGCTRGTVAAYLHRALKRIAADLQASGLTIESI